jgi:hypothetical protein
MNDRGKLRVNAHEYSKVWGNIGLPVPQDLASLAAFIRSGEVTEKSCDQRLIERLHLARVNFTTGEIQFNIARRGCYPGEKFLAFRGKVFVSLGCGNPAQERKQDVSVSGPQPVMVTSAPTPSAKCPDIYTLKVNVWPATAVSFPGVAQAVAAAEAATGAGFHDGSRLSRLGKLLREESARNPDFQRSTIPRLFRISLIRVDQNDQVVAEQPLGDHMVTGLREFKFTPQQLAWDAIRVVDVREEMISPVFHSLSSLREIRFYNTRVFRGLAKGEWDTNPVPDCVMNVHAMEQSAENLPVMMGGVQALPSR